MYWQECCKKRIVKDVKTDEELINSLIKTSQNKSESERKQEMSEIAAASKLSFSLFSASLRKL
jgi:hypothetical protein